MASAEIGIQLYMILKCKLTHIRVNDIIKWGLNKILYSLICVCVFVMGTRISR